MTTINIIFIALFVCALAALIAYRVGLSTGARAQWLKNQTLRNAQAKLVQGCERTIESLTTRLAALLTRLTETEERATHCLARADALAAKQESHQAQLEAIMQDADARVATYARRANPFTEQDRTILQFAANQLDVAANTYAGLKLSDNVRFARQMQQRLLDLAERLDATLQASEQPADKVAA
jgi:chlorite dismutase